MIKEIYQKKIGNIYNNDLKMSSTNIKLSEDHVEWLSLTRQIAEINSFEKII